MNVPWILSRDGAFFNLLYIRSSPNVQVQRLSVELEPISYLNEDLATGGVCVS